MKTLIGSVAVLNVGVGDVRISFDKDKPDERKRSATIIKDMLSRGYAVLVQVGEQNGEPIYRRAKEFDADTCEYIVVGTPEETIPAAIVSAPIIKDKKTLKRKTREYRVPAEKTRAVSVARSAGG